MRNWRICGAMELLPERSLRPSLACRQAQATAEASGLGEVECTLATSAPWSRGAELSVKETTLGHASCERMHRPKRVRAIASRQFPRNAGTACGKAASNVVWPEAADCGRCLLARTCVRPVGESERIQSVFGSWVRSPILQIRCFKKVLTVEEPRCVAPG